MVYTVVYMYHNGVQTEYHNGVQTEYHNGVQLSTINGVQLSTIMVYTVVFLQQRALFYQRCLQVRITKGQWLF